MKSARYYIICTTPRSGSTLLCEALRNTGIAGNPDEYLRRWLDLIRYNSEVPRHNFLEERIEEHSGANGVFGFKTMWPEFDETLNLMRKIPEYRNLSGYETLNRLFPGIRFIWLQRRDKIRQAVSHAKLIQTGIAHKVKGNDRPVIDKDIPFSYPLINLQHRVIIKQERGWNNFFRTSGVKPFKVRYEDFAELYEETAAAILEYLDIPFPEKIIFGPRRLMKTSDRLNQEWTRKYLERYEQYGDDPDICELDDIPKNARVYLYGAGRSGNDAYHFIRTNRKDISITGYIDTFKTGRLNGLEIINPDVLKPDYFSDELILITSQFFLEISESLKKKGITNYRWVDFGYFYSQI